MTYNIESELDRALDEWESKHARATTRRKIARSVFEARRDAIDLRSAHPLARRRLTFREVGLSVPELATRALVSESTIKALEAGAAGSDLTWERLARALAEPGEATGRARQVIDPSHVPA
jgi:hypothetical protein